MGGKQGRLYAVSIASGAVVWLGTMAVSSTREAWDSPLYFSVGMPLIMIVAGVFGYLAPARAWRWGVLPMAAQAGIITAMNPTGSLMPLGLILFAVQSLPCIGAAYLGVLVRKIASRSR